MRAKRGNLLAGEVIFLVLNIIFIVILVLFVANKTSDSSLYEEKYAKQIALLIDAAQPGMVLSLNMFEAVEAGKENGIPINEIVSIDGNIVTVKLSEKGGYGYSFFNDVAVNVYPDSASADNYVITINKK